jgi:hypothetical protein
MFHFLLIFAFLMFFSSFARLDKLMFEFRVAAIDGDRPRLKHLTGRILLQAGSSSSSVSQPIYWRWVEV